MLKVKLYSWSVETRSSVLQVDDPWHELEKVMASEFTTPSFLRLVIVLFKIVHFTGSAKTKVGSTMV